MTNFNAVYLRFFAILAVFLSIVATINPSLAADPLQWDDEIHIAVVGPLSGKTAIKGQSIKRGTQLYVDIHNESRDKNQKKIVLDFYDDQNNPQTALKMAQKIVKDNRAVAVIGHNYSSSSRSAGPVYKKNQIPAISPTSTDISVTQDNDWYFRAVFNDRLQGRFLANYTKSILGSDNVSIISENLTYGRSLADNFAIAAKNLNLNVQYRGEIVVGDKNFTSSIDNIIKQLKNNKKTGTIFLATHATEGVIITSKIRDAGLLNPIITPDSFASKSFRDGFNSLPKEINNPGHYTNGIYVATPLIFDTGNEKAQIFRERFLKEFQDEPDWIAAYSYDSAMLIVQAIIQNKITGKIKSIKKERKQIREFLASLNSSAQGIEGVTGLNFFDENGDAQKPISIGKFQNRSLISAATQLQTIKNIDDIENMDDAVQHKRIILVENNQMHIVKVVFVGFNINKVTELDLKDLTYNLDLFLWFRYHGELDEKEIVFLNEVSPIKLGKAVEEVITDNQTYKRYHIKGKFKANFLDGSNSLRNPLLNHILGLNFRYNKLPRTNLIFVNDVLGMKLGGKEGLTQTLNKAQVLGANSGWLFNDVTVFQDTVTKNSFGSPQYLNISEDIDFSRFNIALSIQKDEMSLRGMFDSELSRILLSVSIVLLIIAVFRSKIAVLNMLNRTFWLSTTFSSFILLLACEVLLLEFIGDTATPNNVASLILVFDILWWLAAAFVINLATTPFLWAPLEKKTKQKIPVIIRRFLTLSIFVLASFGIIAFVFDQRLTSLLATSGMIAMIIGLAIQVNISNVFSGIAINIERPFRIGDWVKIGDIDAGRVDDITWRTTKIWNRDGSITRIPNSSVAESNIQNFTGPTCASSTWIFIDVNPKHSPVKVEAILQQSLLSVPEVLKTPPPFASFRGVEEWSANYMLGFNIQDYGQLLPIRKKVAKKIWADLRLAGIEFAIKRWNIIETAEAIETEEPFSPKRVMEDLGLYNALPDPCKLKVEDGSLIQKFAPGQNIVNYGDICSSIIVIVEGVCAINTNCGEDKNIELRRLGAGEYFGEEAILNGDTRTAGMVATTNVRIMEINKQDLLSVFNQDVETKGFWNKMLRDSTKEIAEHAAKLKEKQLASDTSNSSGFMQRFKRLFS
ncbi:MAG: mechanosensitive ion channel [Magnetococcales bacterium]|nr:mechanosensitive ion channel [Magnetococcales bacterium]